MTDMMHELRSMAYAIAALAGLLALLLQTMKHSREILQALKDKWTWRTEAKRAVEELKYAKYGKAELIERLESHRLGQGRMQKKQDRCFRQIEKWRESTGCKTPEAFKSSGWQLDESAPEEKEVLA